MLYLFSCSLLSFFFFSSSSTLPCIVLCVCVFFLPRIHHISCTIRGAICCVFRIRRIYLMKTLTLNPSVCDSMAVAHNLYHHFLPLDPKPSDDNKIAVLLYVQADRDCSIALTQLPYMKRPSHRNYEFRK